MPAPRHLRAERRSRSERGAALVELALVAPVFALLLLSAIDLGRTAQVQNRLLNSAREGAAIVQTSPTSIDTGCRGDRNVTDRVEGQDEDLTDREGYEITVAKKVGTTLTEYTGCTTATGGLTFAPGDKVVVTVEADVRTSAPLTRAIFGEKVELERKVEVVVLG